MSASSGTLQLVIRFGRWVRREALGNEPIVLGRARECDVQVPDPTLSRRHCRILPAANGGWLVEDLESRAGTRCDGVPLTAPAPLAPGSRLELGLTVAELSSRLDDELGDDLAPGASHVELLLHTVGELYATDDLDELLGTIVDRTIRVSGGERGALLLAGPEGSLEIAVARDARGRDLPQEQVLTRSLAGRVLQSGRPVVLTDVELTGSSADVPLSVLEGGLRSVVCVPLPGPEGPTGVLYVDGRRPARDFGPSALVVFEALALHSALAIERGRLRQQHARREAEARQRLERENASLREQLGDAGPVGESEPMRRALAMARRVAPSDAAVCITGETGTGKEVLARHLHRFSPRAGGPFVVVDCGAIPESLIESELFGHEKGAFTGAATARPGRFREARGGTVLLDEIGELPLALQSRLLRVLQEHTVQPLGATGVVPVDVRVLCATNRDLAERVASGAFRQDLYYRLGVLEIRLPPLRERGEDVLLLARHFLARFSALAGSGATDFTREAHQALLEHRWPGNVRELELRVQRAVLLASGPFVTTGDLGLGELSAQSCSELAEDASSVPPLQQARSAAVERFERAYLEKLLHACNGNVSRAAALAGVSRQALHTLLRRHGVDRRRFEA